MFYFYTALLASIWALVDLSNVFKIIVYYHLFTICMCVCVYVWNTDNRLKIFSLT